MYNSQNIEKEPSLMEIKAEVKLSLISIFSVQLAFQIFATIYIQAISYFQSIFNFSLLNPRGLSNFVWDMWLIAILLSCCLFGYSNLKKAKYFPVYLLIVYPAIVTILSLVRDVSLVQVVILSLLSYVVVLQLNYQRVKQLEFSKV